MISGVNNFSFGFPKKEFKTKAIEIDIYNICRYIYIYLYYI